MYHCEIYRNLQRATGMPGATTVSTVLTDQVAVSIYSMLFPDDWARTRTVQQELPVEQRREKRGTVIDHKLLQVGSEG